jgi:tetratricopeptide (TPR) repeat protein
MVSPAQRKECYGSIPSTRSAIEPTLPNAQVWNGHYLNGYRLIGSLSAMMPLLCAGLLCLTFILQPKPANAKTPKSRTNSSTPVGSLPELKEADRLEQEFQQLKQAGEYDAAIKAMSRVVSLREQAAGPDNLALASSLNKLAEMYRKKDKYDDAEPLLQRALRIRQKILPADHPDIAESLNDLADVFLYDNRFKQAQA